MTKSTTTPLKLFQWLLINLAVTMAGLRWLPFLQMPAKRSLRSATKEKGGRHWCGEKGLPGAGSWPGLAGGHGAEVSTASTQAEKLGWHQNRSASLRAWPGASSDVLSSPLPLPQVSLCARAAATTPLCLGIDYFSLSGLIH